jgi:hypothetical protein
MRIKCIDDRVMSGYKNYKPYKSPHLTIGKVYKVLGIIQENIGSSYQIISDNGEKQVFYDIRFKVCDRLDKLNRVLEDA